MILKLLCLVCWQKGYGEARHWQACYLHLGRQLYLTCMLPLQIGKPGTVWVPPALQSQLTTHLGEPSLRALLLILSHGCLTIARFIVPSLRTARNIVHSIVVYNIKQSCLILSNPMAYSPADSSVHGILQARILEWVAVRFSRGSSSPGIKPGSPALQVDSLPSESPGKPTNNISTYILYSYYIQNKLFRVNPIIITM